MSLKPDTQSKPTNHYEIVFLPVPSFLLPFSVSLAVPVFVSARLSRPPFPALSLSFSVQFSQTTSSQPSFPLPPSPFPLSEHRHRRRKRRNMQAARRQQCHHCSRRFLVPMSAATAG